MIPLATRRLEEASGSLYYAGTRIFYGQRSGLRNLPHDIVPWKDGRCERSSSRRRARSASTLPCPRLLRLGAREPYFGALIVAKPRAELRERWRRSSSGSCSPASSESPSPAPLAWYLTRRITKPV